MKVKTSKIIKSCNKILQRIKYDEVNLGKREYPKIGDFVNIYFEGSGGGFDGAYINDSININGVIIIGEYNLPSLILENGDEIAIQNIAKFGCYINDVRRIEANIDLIKEIKKNSYDEIFDEIFE